MRILAIGDIHGKDVWKQAIDKVEADCFVFIGDYVNAKQWIGDTGATENLKQIIDFKRRNTSRVHLLIGNHDLLFLREVSAFRKLFFPVMYKVYRENADCFRVAFQYDNFLFSHAGLTNAWNDRHRDVINNAGQRAADALNSVYESDRSAILFEKGRSRGGAFAEGSPIFADKMETERDPLSGYTQIVGHTKVPAPVSKSVNNGTVIYIDCLNSVHRFVMIDHNCPRIFDLKQNTWLS